MTYLMRMKTAYIRLILILLVGVLVGICIVLELECVLQAPDHICVELFPNNRVAVNGNELDFSEVESYVKSLRKQYYDPLKRIGVCYEGGESQTCEEIVHIMMMFATAGFPSDGYMLDGSVFRTCDGDAYEPNTWWYNQLPNESIIITVLVSNYQYRVVGNLATEDAEEESAAREAWLNGEEWRRKETSSLSFVQLGKVLNEKLTSDNNVAIKVNCLPSVPHWKLLEILRICRVHDVKYVFIRFLIEDVKGSNDDKRGGKEEGRGRFAFVGKNAVALLGKAEGSRLDIGH